MRATRLLRSLSEIVVAYPRQLLLGAGIVSLLGIFALRGLEIEAGHSGLVDRNDPHQRQFSRFLERFGSPNLLFAIVEGGNERWRQRVINGLMTRLPGGRLPDRHRADVGCRVGPDHNRPGCVRDVFARVDLTRLARYALLYLPREELQNFVHVISEGQQDLVALTASRNLPALTRAITEALRRRAATALPEGTSAVRMERLVEAVTAFVNRIEHRVREDDSSKPLDALLAERLDEMRARFRGGAGIDRQGYLVSRDGRLHIAVIRSADDSDDPAVIVPFVDYVQRVADSLVREAAAACTAGACKSGPLRVAITGLPALAAAEKKSLSRDLTVTTALAIGGILALFVFGFRSVRQGLLGLVPLVVALLGTLAVVRVTVGSLNLLTSAFIPTVLGLGIDFTVHLLARYNEARRAGAGAVEGMRTGITRAGPAMVTGALTTAGAFTALAVCKFKGFAQLGLITAVGLMLSLLATVTVVASMLVLPSLRWLQRPPREPYLGNAKLVARLVARHRWLVLIGAGLLTVVLVWRARGIPWSYDYMDLLPRHTPAVAGMRELADRTNFSGEVAAVIASDFAQARKITSRLSKLKSVGHVESLTEYVPSDQPAKLRLIRALRRTIDRLQVSPAKARGAGSDVRSFVTSLEGLIDTLQDVQFAARRAGRPEADLLKPAVTALERLRSTVERTPAAPAERRLNRIQNEAFAALAAAVALIREASSVDTPLTEAKMLTLLPDGLRERLYQRGSYAIYIYPKHSLWGPGILGAFVADLRSVVPAVTGFPVTYWETNVSIAHGFHVASALAAAALLVLLLADFRSLRFTLLALLPLAMGVCWMWGGMSLLGMRYNFANIIAFPLIIGIGVASSVHILHRFRQEGEHDVEPVVRHTGLAILLSALTTMVGFGSLSLASHRGAASLGKVLLMGVGACLATSTLVLPALLQVLCRWRRARDPTKHGLGRSCDNSIEN